MYEVGQSPIPPQKSNHSTIFSQRSAQHDHITQEKEPKISSKSHVALHRVMLLCKRVLIYRRRALSLRQGALFLSQIALSLHKNARSLRKKSPS